MCTQENVEAFKEMFKKISPKYISDLLPHMTRAVFHGQDLVKLFKNYLNSEYVRVDIDIDINATDRNGNVPIKHMGYVFKGCGNLIVNFHVKEYLIADELLEHIAYVEGTTILSWLNEIFFKYLGLDASHDFADITFNFFGDNGKNYGSYTLKYESINVRRNYSKNWIKIDD